MYTYFFINIKVITFRFDELKDNAILMSKLHDLYLKSALCDAKLIERMAAVLWIFIKII